MKPKMIKENNAMKYRVLLRGKVVTECFSVQLANDMVASLSVEDQQFAEVVPVTIEGKQLLNEMSSLI